MTAAARPQTKDSLMATKAMLTIVAAVFVAEFLMMLALRAAGQASYGIGFMLLDASVLACLTAPFIYVLVLLPIRREYTKRLDAELRAQDMSHLAITDSLTHIMNRRGITLAVLDLMAQTERYGGALTLGMADLDHFKDVNDTHGHPAGDEVLTQVAGVLTDGLRMPDKIGRYGGEEFLIVLPHTTLAAAKKIAERLRASVAKQKIQTHGKTITTTISIGLTPYRKGEDLEHFISRVDAALYDAKQKGRNRVVVKKSK
jgi:diguanylate cyclase (GGDEF)-like protein